jgi:hypothetical protein
MTLRICVVCYGDEHASLYEQVAVRSLLQTRNRAAIPAGTIVAVYSDATTMDRVATASEPLGIVERHIVAIPTDPNAHYSVQTNAFVDEIGIAVRTDATMLMLGPDNFWGDGSLGNLLAIAGETQACFAVPHVRVDQAVFLAGLAQPINADVKARLDDPIDIPNPRLASLAFVAMHPSWRDADLTKPDANSFITGIGWRDLGNGLYAIHHLQPTVFLARPNARDYGFFAERRHVLGIWDHFWPEILAQEGRLRTIASSDAVCIVELTKASTHNTELRKLDPKKPDDFHRTGAHISMNRNVVAIWRAP